MADILLLETTLLTVKTSGKIAIPQKGRTNAAAVKAVIEILKYADPEILFAGDETLHTQSNVPVTENCLIANIHVIDAPSVINFSRSDAELFSWFLRQIRSNKKHIVLKNEFEKNGFVQTVIDIYVRGIFIPTRESKVHKLYNHSNSLNYAV